VPLAKGTSRKTIAANIAEFHTGKTYAHTKAKFGKKTADRQAVAASLSTARRSGKRPNNGLTRDILIADLRRMADSLETGGKAT